MFAAACLLAACCCFLAAACFLAASLLACLLLLACCCLLPACWLAALLPAAGLLAACLLRACVNELYYIVKHLERHMRTTRREKGKYKCCVADTLVMLWY
jgi:hypothetical protein